MLSSSEGLAPIKKKEDNIIIITMSPKTIYMYIIEVETRTNQNSNSCTKRASFVPIIIIIINCILMTHVKMICCYFMYVTLG